MIISHSNFVLIDLVFLLITIILCNLPLQIIYKIKFEEALSTSIGFIVVFLYIFSYLKILFIGPFTILFLSIIFILYNSKKIFNERILANLFFTPGLVIFLISIILFYSKFYDSKIIQHDDINYWGLSIKNMFYLNDFNIGLKANNGYQDYPPGMNLFAYFFLKIKGELSEPLFFFSKFIWFFSVIIYPLKNFSFKNYRIICLYLIFGFSLPLTTALENPYMNINPDILLALIFGLGLYISTKINKEVLNYEFVQIIICILMLNMLKHTGLIFSIFIIFSTYINLYAAKNK